MGAFYKFTPGSLWLPLGALSGLSAGICTGAAHLARGDGCNKTVAHQD